MSRWTITRLCLPVLWMACLFSASAQQVLPPDAVPSTFNADSAFAEKLRARVGPLTQPVTGRYSTGKQVLDRLTQQLPATQRHYAWEVRISRSAGNVFSSPDGTIYVDQELADFLDARSGLWAAALAHEIEHVVRRDWARRYLYEKSLNVSSISQPVIGSGLTQDSWVNPSSSPDLYKQFCRSLELEADAEALMLMARAGFHPDFMPALYHLLQAGPIQLQSEQLDSSYPRWDQRYMNIQSHSIAAGKEFSRLWATSHDSPGGNPPVVVYTEAASVHRDLNGDFQLRVQLHCDNMYGGAEVALRLTTLRSNYVRELRSDTGCTSNNTVLSFTIPRFEKTRSGMQGVVTVLDDRGDLVTRWILPNTIR